MMRSKSPSSLLAVFAHPDDEAFSVAGTFAKSAKLGVKTSLVCATLGQAGTKRHIKKNQDLAKVREKELKKSAKILKIKSLYLLGYQDGQLHKANIDELKNTIEKIIKIENPKVIITFGPEGVTGHADHVTMSYVTTAAFKNVCNQKLQRLLYVAPTELSATGQKYIKFHKKTDTDVLIDINEFWPTKLAAIKCHFSQDDVRRFFRTVKKQPVLEESFVLAAGPKFKQTPASDLFEE